MIMHDVHGAQKYCIYCFFLLTMLKKRLSIQHRKSSHTINHDCGIDVVLQSFV
jgi:hypothetical protein